MKASLQDQIVKPIKSTTFHILMQLTPITPAEGRILKAMIAGYLSLLLIIVTWTGFVLFSDPFTPSLLAYPALLFFVFMIVFLSKATKLLVDIAGKQIAEGTGVITNQGMTWGKEYYIQMDIFGQEKIKLQRKDYWKLVTGSKILYRITPKSRLLIGYSLVM